MPGFIAKLGLVAVALLFPLLIQAQTGKECYQKGKDYYEGKNGITKDYTEAFKWYKKGADLGNANCINALGLMYKSGHGVVKDSIEAARMYQKAAEMGLTSAQYNYGLALLNGSGIKKNEAEGAKWIQKAAEKGSVSAQSKLGSLYLKGNGVLKDYAESIKWSRKAAEQNNAVGYNNLGYMYELGWGVEIDYDEAIRLYKKALEINPNYESAKKNLASVERRQKNYPQPTKADLEKAELLYKMGEDYARGSHKDGPDAKKALSCYKKAAEKGLRTAQYSYARSLEKGRGTTPDLKEAAIWYLKAARKGYGKAQYALGRMYRDGKGFYKDPREAVQWFQNSAAQGYEEGLNAMGEAYLDGLGELSKDYDKAIAYFKKAAEKGSPIAENNLGWCYLKGIGVEANADSAYSCFFNALYDVPFLESAKKGIGIAKTRIKAAKAAIPKAILEVDTNSIVFEDPSGLNAIREGVECKVRFNVKNSGNATAHACWINLDYRGNEDKAEDGLPALEFIRDSVGDIKVGETKTCVITIQARARLSDGHLKLNFWIASPNDGFSDHNYLTLETKSPDTPKVRITDYSLTAESGHMLKKKEPFDLQLILQNTDHGLAEDVSVDVELPSKVLLVDGEERSTYAKLESGEAKSIVYSLIVRNDYTNSIIPITIHLMEKTGKYAEDRTINLTLDQSFASRKLSTKDYYNGLANNEEKTPSDVDLNIPVNKQKQQKNFALIIANENYEEVDPVPFAANDGAMFKAYCQQTLGIPEENIHSLSDATLGKMRRQVEWLQEVAQAYGNEARIIVYYAGHGIPDEKDKTAYLLPVDGFGRDVKTALPLNELYATLAKLSSQSVTLFLDACFSGAKREGNMLVAARGVAIKVKQTVPEGNLVVFSAAQGDETAHPFDEQQHGMFTYYLLKKLKESKAELTMGELTDYVRQQVMQQSMKRNGKMQTPTVVSSSAMSTIWKDMKLK